MAPDLKVITTSDGSHSLYHPLLKETYHSTHGAITESQHVFIQKGLAYQKSLGLDAISVLEVGFGTGLNALLTLHFAHQHPEMNIIYHSLEPFPLPTEIVDQLNYAQRIGLSSKDFKNLHECAWDEPIDLRFNFHLLKMKSRLEHLTAGERYDLVYFDAFAPSKQKEMWDISILNKVYEMMNPGGVFVTYCAQGQLKRSLKAIGLEIESLNGPPGKKEMTRAVKYMNEKKRTDA